MKRPRRENFLNPKFKDTIEVFLHNLAIINNCKKLSSEYAEEISIKLAKEIINNIDSKLNYHYNKDTEVDNIEK